ncbi:DUF2398 family protein [Actinomadura geliboluensis]|uniref:DUF2398 family protein n=1 Tax=Actinomadura geliboluensis TaxID=882440 RepID=UPI00369AD8B2
MAEPRAATDIPVSELGSFQTAVRLVLTNDIITPTHPRPGVLERVLPWADQLTRDLRELFGYTLVATTHQVRLVRRLDVLDPSRGKVFISKTGRPWDRRRIAYLCLIMSTFQRSRVEVSLADMVRAFAPLAAATGGLGFDPLVQGHKAAVVDVVTWLVDRGALRLSDGSAESWARSADGDALYDIDHDICAALLRPARPIQHLTTAAGLLEAPASSVEQRVRRLLLERPVVYFDDLDSAAAAVLRREDVTDNLARLTGLVAERRAEGVALIDASGLFTDRPFPGRGGALSRAAGLLLAKIADELEGRTLHKVEAASHTSLQADLLDRIDAGLPADGIVHELAWAPPQAPPPPGVATGAHHRLYFVERHRLEKMISELFEEFGASSFTATWQADPIGLLGAALTLLTDLALLRPNPGGAVLLPAALRYRNITMALPTDDGQLDLFGGADTTTSSGSSDTSTASDAREGKSA